jgi:SPFH domain / Band 7 family
VPGSVCSQSSKGREETLARYYDQIPALHLSCDWPGVCFNDHYAQQALRDSVAELSFETILATRSTINTRMRDLLVPQADALGLRLLKIEVRDLMLPGEAQASLRSNYHGAERRPC